MKVSVIIPTYNRAQTLKRSIDSVLVQSFKNFELIIVDDGSTDNTPLLLKEYEGHPQVILLQQENKGVSSARNFGIKATQSPLIAFLDSDDEWLPQKLEVQIKNLNENPELRFFHSNEYWIRNDVKVNIPQKFDKSNKTILERSLHHCLISPSTVLLRRELLNDVGLFDEELTVCEDYDLWLRILTKENVFHEEAFLIKKHGGHADQLSMKYFAMDFWRVKSLLKLLENGPIQRELIQKVLLDKLSLLIRGYLKHENFKDLERLKELVLQSAQLDWATVFANSNHHK